MNAKENQVQDEILRSAVSRRDAELSPSRLARIVVDSFAEAILSGRLKPGDPLPAEGKIAAAFGISKPIAKEAIRDLEALGIVQMNQGKVARVRQPDAEPLGRFFQFAVRGTRTGLANAVEMRQVIEPPIARLAAQRRTGTGLEKLDAALKRLKLAVRGEGSWIEADLDFHEVIAEISGNELLHLQIQGLRPVGREVMEFFKANNKRSATDWTRFVDRHAAIATAIERGDPDQAFRAMEEHFEEGRAVLRNNPSLGY